MIRNVGPLDGGVSVFRAAMRSLAPTSRELAARESNGVRVVLLWHPRQNAVTVSVEDVRAGDGLDLAVEREIDAFYHPVAHAA